jgi:hypothetical protein
MANKDNKHKKEIVQAFLFGVPMVAFFICCFIASDGGFDGTFMEDLFPAIFSGFISGFATLLVASNIFKYSTTLWVVATAAVFVLTVVFSLLSLTTALTIIMAVPIGLLLLLALIRWIAGS